MDKMNSTKTTSQFPEQDLLAELRADQVKRQVEDHIRQRDAHTEVIVDLLREPEVDFDALVAHGQAARLHDVAIGTGHQADATRAWEATMTAAEIDGSV